MNKLLELLRHGLSYVVPLTRRLPSEHSGWLEVTLHRGHKELNTAEANYSYGSLERVLRYGLLFAPIGAQEPALVLGLGGGSVIKLLRQERGLTAPITALELDAAVIEVAATEFGVRPDAQLRIICADALAWVAQAPAAAFGLVVVDLFLGLELPAGLHEAGFWRHLHRVLRPGGYVVFNLLMTTELWPDGQELPEFLAGLGFEVKDLEVETYNRLLVLRKPSV
ncbi:spermidine synthase [Hymenobacter perfusus]|uniref:Methyltransferase domain-containing protein n=1 Tax=Hymenobacter perfusus TaxID=1236770 RepID=A0A428KI36_9BACT|nr:methyltransferase domain-containing protein [Hymenobacter perfusus]RSK46133.1 methyltransferase domain-containing protein [Hymenobacter perfusus]